MAHTQRSVVFFFCRKVIQMPPSLHSKLKHQQKPHSKCERRETRESRRWRAESWHQTLLLFCRRRTWGTAVAVCGHVVKVFCFFFLDRRWRLSKRPQEWRRHKQQTMIFSHWDLLQIRKSHRPIGTEHTANRITWIANRHVYRARPDRFLRSLCATALWPMCNVLSTATPCIAHR